MIGHGETLWTIDDLGNQVAQALSVGYEGQASGRVRDVPDRRTIRYYTTLGLIDRPARMRGRTALYSRRHLLQVVAIKRLQARGLALADLQQQLLGLSDAALEQVARIPAAVEAKAEEAGPSERANPVEERSFTFWKAEPAAAPGELAEQNGSLPVTTAAAAASVLMQGVALSESATLLLTPARPVTADDQEAILAAAGRLLRVLEARGLVRPARDA
jgi:DNA-binding transcriptional MerR regulator